MEKLSLNTLPFSVRAAFSIVMFAEASALLYLLATRFPIEIHVYVASCLFLSLIIRQTLLLRSSTEHKLHQALNELKKLTGIGGELQLRWMPNANKTLHGEVRNNTIYIYDEKFEDAIETLVEEFLEYSIFKASQPYLNILNAIIKNINETAYKERDKIAKGLSKPLLKLVEKKINTQNKK